VIEKKYVYIVGLLEDLNITVKCFGSIEMRKSISCQFKHELELKH